MTCFHSLYANDAIQFTIHAPDMISTVVISPVASEWDIKQDKWRLSSRCTDRICQFSTSGS